MKYYRVHCLNWKKTLILPEDFLMEMPDMPQAVKDSISILELGQSFTAHFTDLSFRFTRTE